MAPLTNKAVSLALAKIKRAAALELARIAPTMSLDADKERLRERAQILLKEAIELETEVLGLGNDPN